MALASTRTTVKYAQLAEGVALVNSGDWNSTWNYKYDDKIRPYVRYAPTGKFFLRTSKGDCVEVNPHEDTSNRYWKYTSEWDLILARKIQAHEIDVDSITLGHIINGTGMLIGKDAHQGKMGVYAAKQGKTSFWLSAETGESIFAGTFKTPFVPLVNADATPHLTGKLLRNDMSIISPIGEQSTGVPWLVYLPDSIDYNGAHVKIMNNNFPPYTRTSLRYTTAIRAKTGTIKVPDNIVSIDSVSFHEVQIIGGMIELVAVPNLDYTKVDWVCVNKDAIVSKD